MHAASHANSTCLCDIYSITDYKDLIRNKIGNILYLTDRDFEQVLSERGLDTTVSKILLHEVKALVISMTEKLQRLLDKYLLLGLTVNAIIDRVISTGSRFNAKGFDNHILFVRDGRSFIGKKVVVETDQLKQLSKSNRGLEIIDNELTAWIESTNSKLAKLYAKAKITDYPAEMLDLFFLRTLDPIATVPMIITSPEARIVFEGDDAMVGSPVYPTNGMIALGGQFSLAVSTSAQRATLTFTAVPNVLQILNGKLHCSLTYSGSTLNTNVFYVIWVTNDPSNLNTPLGYWKTQSQASYTGAMMQASGYMLTQGTPTTPVSITKSFTMSTTLWSTMYIHAIALGDVAGSGNFIAMVTAEFFSSNVVEAVSLGSVATSSLNTNLVSNSLSGPLSVDIASKTMAAPLTTDIFSQSMLTPLKTDISSKTMVGALDVSVSNTPLPVSTVASIPITVNVASSVPVTGSVNTVITDVKIPNQSTALDVLLGDGSVRHLNQKDLEGGFNPYGNGQTEKPTKNLKTVSDIQNAFGTIWIALAKFDILERHDFADNDDDAENISGNDFKSKSNIPFGAANKRAQKKNQHEQAQSIKRDQNGVTTVTQTREEKLREKGTSTYCKSNLGEDLRECETISDISKQLLKRRNERIGQMSMVLKRLQQKCHSIHKYIKWLLDTVNSHNPLSLAFALRVLDSLSFPRLQLGLESCVRHILTSSLDLDIVVCHIMMLYLQVSRTKCPTAWEKADLMYKSRSMDWQPVWFYDDGTGLFCDGGKENEYEYHGQNPDVWWDRIAWEHVPSNSVKKFEGSFNPYGNGQTDPLTALAIGAGGTLAGMAADAITGAVPNIISTISSAISPTPVSYNTAEREYLERILMDRGNIENNLLRLMEDKAGTPLTKDSANRYLEANYSEPTMMNSLISGLAGLTGDNKFIGPNYSGGILGGTKNLRELAERLAVEPLSNADKIARQHDLLYAIADKPADKVAADVKMISELENLDSKTFQDHLVLNSMRAKTALDRLNEYYNPTAKAGYKVDTSNEVKQGSFNPYGNGQPITLMKLLTAMKAAYEDTKVWNKPTLHGIDPPNARIQGAQMDPEVHDTYFLNRGRRRERTINNLALLCDGIICFTNMIPRRLFLPAGLSAVAPINNTVIARYALGGAGPVYQVGALAKPFLQKISEQDVTSFLKTISVNTALANGNINYSIFRQSYSEINVDGLNPSGGSNGMIYGNILMYSQLFNVNARYCSINNQIRGTQVKPSALGNAAGLWPNNQTAVQDFFVWAIKVDDYMKILSGDYPAGCAYANWVQAGYNPDFSFETPDMQHSSYDTSLTLWRWVQQSYCITKPTETCTLKAVTDAGFVAQGAQDAFSTTGGSSVYQETFLNPVTNRTEVHQIVVLLDYRAQLGAMGQQAIAFNVFYGRRAANLVVSSTINNPLLAPGGIAAAGVNCGAEVLLVANAFIAGDMTLEATNCNDWFVRFYGSKRDRTMGVMYATLFSSSFLPMPQTSLTNGLNVPMLAKAYRTTTATNVDAAPLTDLILQGLYTQFVDIFGQPQQDHIQGTPLYYISKQNPTRRLALFMGLLTTSPEDTLSTSDIMQISPATVFPHLLEFAEGIMSTTDSFRADTGMAFSSYNGVLSGNGVNTNTVNRHMPFTTSLVEYVCEHFDIKGMLITRPVPSNLVSTTSRTSLERITYDKLWEGCPWYELSANDIYRKTDLGLGYATYKNYWAGNAQIAPDVVSMPSKDVDAELSKWLQPNYNYTQLQGALASQAISVFIGEKNLSRMSSVFVNQIIDSGSKWLETYLGNTLTFTARDVGPNLALSNFITDYTVQPSFGPFLGQRACLYFNGLAQATICNQEVPAFEAYKLVSYPTANFNAPSINQDFQAFENVMRLFNGKSATDADTKK